MLQHGCEHVQCVRNNNCTMKYMQFCSKYFYVHCTLSLLFLYRVTGDLEPIPGHSRQGTPSMWCQPSHITGHTYSHTHLFTTNNVDCGRKPEHGEIKQKNKFFLKSAKFCLIYGGLGDTRRCQLVR